MAADGEMRGMIAASTAETSGEGRSPGWALVAVLALYLAVHFHVGTLLIAQTNRNRLATDQQNNIELALASRADALPMRTDGVVNPLWPWVASRFATENQEAFFHRGRWFNLAWTAVAACIAAALASRALPLTGVAALLFAGGIGAWLPQAVWFQPEPLYFVLFAASAALAWASIRRNPLPVSAALGATAGLAYLAKASVTLLLGAWIVASLLRAALGALRREVWTEWRPARFVLGAALAGAVFGAVIAPRAVYSWQRFGDPLHSYPKYWMWHDDFGRESVPFMAAHPDAGSLRSLTAEDRPSAANYFKAHGFAAMAGRLRDGVGSKVARFLLPEGRWSAKRSARGWKSPAPARGLWLLPPVLLCAAFALGGLFLPGLRRDWTVAGVSRAAFAAVSLALYLLAYGWYDPIGRGDRFMMSLYVPLLALAVFGAFGMAGPRRIAAHVACLCTLVLVLARVAQVVADPVFAG